MEKIILIIPAIILITLVILAIKATYKKKKNIPLKGIERIFLSLCSVTVLVIPEEVTDVFEFSTGKWGIKNIGNINWKEMTVNRKDNVLENIGFEFPSEEHDEFKNKLMIYGKYVSEGNFGPNSYVFTDVPDLSFTSNNCKMIYDFLKKHTQNKERILVELEYGNVPQSEYMIYPNNK